MCVINIFFADRSWTPMTNAPHVCHYTILRDWVNFVSQNRQLTLVLLIRHLDQSLIRYICKMTIQNHIVFRFEILSGYTDEVHSGTLHPTRRRPLRQNKKIVCFWGENRKIEFRRFIFLVLFFSEMTTFFLTDFFSYSYRNKV